MAAAHCTRQWLQAPAVGAPRFACTPRPLEPRHLAGGHLAWHQCTTPTSSQLPMQCQCASPPCPLTHWPGRRERGCHHERGGAVRRREAVWPGAGAVQVRTGRVPRGQVRMHGTGVKDVGLSGGGGGGVCGGPRVAKQSETLVWALVSGGGAKRWALVWACGGRARRS